MLNTWFIRVYYYLVQILGHSGQIRLCLRSQTAVRQHVIRRESRRRIKVTTYDMRFVCSPCELYQFIHCRGNLKTNNERNFEGTRVMMYFLVEN